MKKGLLLMTVLLFVSVVSMAQKVVTDANKRAIIDYSDMPAKTITMEKKWGDVAN